MLGTVQILYVNLFNPHIHNLRHVCLLCHKPHFTDKITKAKQIDLLIHEYGLGV